MIDEEICTRTHFIDIINDAVNNLSLERLEYNRSISHDELCLAASTQYHSFSNVQNGDNSDDVSKCAGTCSLNIRVEFRFKELKHPRSEVGRMQQDCV